MVIGERLFLTLQAGELPQSRSELFSQTASANSSYGTPLILATTCAITRTYPSALAARLTYLCGFHTSFDSETLFPLLSL
jgi:hypothetical protein